jgi:hypothetical protein
MEAVRTSETSVDNYFTRQYIPEDNSELKSSSSVHAGAQHPSYTMSLQATPGTRPTTCSMLPQLSVSWNSFKLKSRKYELQTLRVTDSTRLLQPLLLLLCQPRLTSHRLLSQTSFRRQNHDGVTITSETEFLSAHSYSTELSPSQNGFFPQEFNTLAPTWVTVESPEIELQYRESHRWVTQLISLFTYSIFNDAFGTSDCTGSRNFIAYAPFWKFNKLHDPSTRIHSNTFDITLS